MRKNLLYLFPMWLFALQASSQVSNYTLRNYSTENGLPQNSVREIATDEYGFTWLSTEAGMVRFDGQNFRNFNMANSSPLKHSDRMRQVFSDAVGTIFFTNTAYDIYRTNSWNTISPITLLEDKPAGRKLVDIKGVVFEQTRFEDVFNDLLKNCNNCQASSLQNAFFSKGFFYLINKDELYVEARVLPSSEFYYITGNSNNNKSKLITSCRAGMYYFLNDTLFTTGTQGSFEAYYKSENTFVSLPITGDVLKDPLYLPTLANMSIHGRGKNTIIQMDKNFYTLRRIGNTIHTRVLFSNLYIPNISYIHYDSINQQYFFGTSSDGLFVVKQKPFENIQLQSQDASSSYKNIVANQLLFAGNNIAINTGVVFDSNGLPKRSMPEFVSSFRDSEGNCWYTNHSALYKLTDRGRLLFTVPIPRDDGTGFFTEDALSGTIWYSQKTANLLKIRQEGNAGFLDTINYPADQPVSISYVRATAKSQLWIGSTNGLYQFDERAGSLQRIPGSEGKNVRYVLHDSTRHIVWVATYGQGIGYVKNGSYTNLPLDNANNLLSTHCFIPDNNGFFWMPTNHGLLQVAQRDWLNHIDKSDEKIYYQYYNNQDGFASNEFNGGSSMPFIRRSDSLISLPTMKGLVWFYPDRIVPLQPVNRIFVDNIKVDNKDTIITNGLQLPYNYGQVTLSVATPYYGNKENLALEYQLTGSGKSWNEIPNRQIILSQLPHGKYVITIRCRSGFGSRYNYADFSFEVLPAWYQSKWFYALLILLTISLIVWLVRFRIKQLVNSKRKLEQEVENRTATLVETLANYELINSKLEQTQQQLLDADKTKETIISIILHDLWSPLNYLSDTAGRMAMLTEKYSKEELLRFIKAMAVSTADVTQLTDNLLNWLRSQKGSFTPQLQPVHLPLMLSGITRLYKEIAAQKGNILTVDCTDDLVVSTDPAVLTLVVRNLVDNANKNTLNGNIVVSVYRNAEYKVAIEISDTGKGLPNETIREIMELNGSHSLRPGSLGFRFVFDFAKVIDITIAIEENRKTGFAITILLPATINGAVTAKRVM